MLHLFIFFFLEACLWTVVLPELIVIFFFYCTDISCNTLAVVGDVITSLPNASTFSRRVVYPINVTSGNDLDETNK